MTLLDDVRTSSPPSLLHLPSGVVGSLGQEAIDLAASVDIVLDPWECDILAGGCSYRVDGSWAAFEVGEILPRQNGKGEVLLVRQLGGLYLFDERLQVHSAHEFKTSYEHFLRIKAVVENYDDLRKKVRIIRTGAGDQSIELVTGQRLRFLTRSRSSGRGFTGDTIYLDEAFHLPVSAMGALLPTLSARPNPQLWYASSAPMYTSEFLHGLLKRAGQPGEDRLYLAAWENPPGTRLDDVEAIRRANPAMGYRLTLEFTETERRALCATPEGVAEYARERLGIREGGDGEAGVVPYDVWSELVDGRSQVAGSPCFGLQVSPDAQWASFAVAGRRPDGLVHVETVDRRMGTGWIVPRAVELYGKHRVELRVNPNSATGALLKALAEARVPVEEIGGREYAQACVDVLEAVKNRRVRHLDQESLNRSVSAAGKSDDDKGLWVWARPGAVDITPWEAVTLAWTGVAAPDRRPRVHTLRKEASA